MKNIENEIGQLERALLFCNSPHGILIDGQIKTEFKRSFNSPTIKWGNGYTYHKTGEILHDSSHGVDRYLIVYRRK